MYILVTYDVDTTDKVGQRLALTMVKEYKTLFLNAN